MLGIFSLEFKFLFFSKENKNFFPWFTWGILTTRDLFKSKFLLDNPSEAHEFGKSKTTNKQNPDEDWLMVKKSQWKCVFLLHQTLSFLTVFFFHAIDLFLTLLYRKVWQHGSSACCWGLQYVGSRTDLTPFFFKQPSAQEFKEVGLSQCLRGRSWLHCCECVPSLWVLCFVNSSWPHLKDPALVVIFTERLSMAQSPIQGQK